MKLIGLGYKFMGGTVTSISRKGVLIQGEHMSDVRLSLKEAEKLAKEGKFCIT